MTRFGLLLPLLIALAACDLASGDSAAEKWEQMRACLVERGGRVSRTHEDVRMPLFGEDATLKYQSRVDFTYESARFGLITEGGEVTGSDMSWDGLESQSALEDCAAQAGIPFPDE